AGLLALAGCVHGARPPEPAKLAVTAGFVGNAACAQCHAAECRSVAGSRHAKTMHAATREALGPIAPPGGPVPLAGYAVESPGGRLAISRQTPTPETHPLDYALGSGKTGMTYVAVVDGTKLMEARMSYFPHQREWEITPGQEARLPDDTPFGRTHDEDSSRRCLTCHADALYEKETRSPPGFFGVGCESCHGPGKAHVEAMRSGPRGDIHMERLGALGGGKLNDLCGRCHRSVQSIDIDSPMAEQTHRFQPYGLLRSRCRESHGEPLSCLRCHDPHTDASTDRGYYDRICLSCHNGASGPGAPATHKVAGPSNPGRVCPVSRTANCIVCHMRPKPAFLASTFPAKMVDHLISIPPQQRMQRRQ
ncbi:MAG TPA: multiheme c-type cytochrome, partial [Chthonomonadaceae bacterium]|nr:multiheme c-type cytochrome [Chthonomonadaceae bacterium]